LKKNRKVMKRTIIGALSLMLVTPFNVMAESPTQASNPWGQTNKINSLPLEQLQQAVKQDHVFIEDSLNTKSSNLVKVIVELKDGIGQSDIVTTASSAKMMKEQQNTFIQTLTKQGLDVNIEHRFEKVFNGFAMTIPANQIPELAADPNVKAIYEDGIVTATPIFAEDASDGAPFIGAWDINDAGFKGQGMKVGVIDTGVDYHHPDLKDAYKGGYDLVDNDNDPYESIPDGTFGETTHGTHVSGTIVGRNVSGQGVRGVAPEADLYAYRVLGPGGSGYDSDVIAGIDKSVQDDMDVINLSLGNGMEHDPYSASSIAVNNAILAGVTVVLANGNDGVKGRYSVGTPASSDLAISVGASTLANTRYEGDVSISYRNPADWQTVTAQSNPITSSFPVRVMAWDQKDGPEGYAKNLQDVPLVYVGEGTTSDYKSNVKGKAVLITRGDYTFIEKIENAKKAGAIAAFIFDKDSKYKGPIRFYLGAGDYIPTYSLSEEAGIELLKVAETYPDDEFLLDFGAFQPVISAGDEIAPFSSRGPTMNLNIKPDVVAPGANIRSAIATYGGDYSEAYQVMDGTSMAAPHVAGLAVLLKQKNPQFTPFDVKAALMNTAKVLETPKYTMFDQGAGRVQGMNALTADALAMVLEHSKADGNRDGQLDSVEHYTGSVLFGNILPSDSDTVSHMKSILLKDVAGENQDYSVRYELTSAERNGVTLSTPEQVHVAANDQVSFDVSIHVPANTPRGEYQGHIYLTNLTTGAELHLPFVSFVGDVQLGDGFSRADVNYAHFSPNEDGNRDTLPIKFGLYNDAEVVLGELYNLQTGAPLGIAFGYVADEEHPALAAGEHTVEWDGMFLPMFSTEWIPAPDGTYGIALVGFSKIPEHILEQPFIEWIDSELFLERQKPNVTVQSQDFIGGTTIYRVKGHVDGLYPRIGRGDLVKIDYSVRYIVDDRTGGDAPINATNDYGFFYANPDGSFEGEIRVDPGYNRISLEATTPAFHYSERPHNPSYLHLRVDQPTQYIVPPNDDIKLGEEFEVKVDARYVKKLIGADIEFMYDENTMEFLGAEQTEEFKAYGDSVITVNDLGVSEGDIGVPFPGILPGDPFPGPFPDPGEDEELPIMHSYRIGVAFKGLSEGITGNIPYVKLKFKATENIKKVNQNHLIVVTDSKLVSLDEEGKEKLINGFAVQNGVILHAPNKQIIGHVNSFAAEGFTSETDFSQKGIRVLASWDGYWHSETNNYMGGVTKEGVVNTDGSFVISDLPADKTYLVRVLVPGHLPAIMTNVQLLEDSAGIMIPGDVSVRWDYLMLAGNVNHDNDINILDLAIVARHFDQTNVVAEQGDINQDGIVDILDLSYVTANYGVYNENILENSVTIPIPQRPID
jgi:minor extracellular serine protease Vpr